MSQVISKITKKIKEAERFLIVTHVYPDGDNLGSSLALLQALRSFGKEAYFYLYGDMPRIYQWLPCSTEIMGGLPEKDREDWVVISLDSGDPTRMGEKFVEWYDNRLALINIDHHTSNTQFGDINWVDSDYSSTGEMVLEILDALGIDMTPDIATCIYCAVYTDTGRFSYSNTNLRTLTAATRCVEAGAVPHQAYSHVYASRTLEGLKLYKMALQTLRFFAGDGGCAFHIDHRMFTETGTDASDTEGFMETVTQIRQFKIIVFLKENSPGLIKCSLRCRPPINASELAAKFGGGGHPRAAGFTIVGNVEEAYEKFIAEAKDALAAVRR